MKAVAFCPGHITGFFEICRTKDMLSTGSRGAGLCLALGATSEVTVRESNRQSIMVTIDGRQSTAPVTKSAARYLLGQERLAVKIDTRLDLPQSQGFGMSAAGALSAALALSDLLKVDERRAYEAAHSAEITCKSGLGDVSGILGGGIEIRKRPGLPPVGEVVRVPGVPEVVLTVTGRGMLTRSVLSSPSKSRRINKSGGEKVDRLVAKPTLENMMALSAEFARETRLATGKVLEAMDAASRLGMGSMSMLGNSIFAIGDTRGLQAVLSGFGPTWTCSVFAGRAGVI